MPFINGFVLICFSILCIFFAGLYNFIFNKEENGCTMTYMFEYPQFVRITLPDVAKRYKSYALYAYGEGRLTEKVRDMKFTGIPVLFIHGHRGSYKQVRSLASVSLRKALGSKTPFHFDYFAVDLNEEYSGFYGGVLEGQTEFVKISIDRILSLYKGPSRPDSVVLIGHSMGGLIGKGLFVGGDFEWYKVRVLITLATPHSPAVLLDSHSANYYQAVTELWDSAPPQSRGNLTLVSIGGGSRDLIVHSSLTFSPQADISVITSSVSGVWLPVDHLCILWCKELVFVLVRALFDSVDVTTRQISTNSDFRFKIFDYHLLHRSAGNRYNTSVHPEEVVLWKGASDSSTWLRLKKNQLTWSKLDRVSVPTHIVINLASTSPADTLLLHTVNHKTKDWIFTCKSDTSVNGIKICSTGENLSVKGQISPTKDFKRKTALLDLIQLRLEGKTHIVVRTLPSDEHVQISFDLFRKEERTIIGQGNYLKSTELLRKTEPGEMYHSIMLPDLFRTWNFHQLVITADNCTALNLAHVSVNVPWSNEGLSTVLSEGQHIVNIRTFTPKPTKRDTKNVNIDILLNPECSYNVRLQKSLGGAIGAIVAKWYMGVIPFMSVCLLMTLSKQVRSLQEEGECPLLHMTMPQAAKPYYILPSANIAAAFARYLPTVFPWVPVSDVHLHSGFMETLFIPLLLHCSSVAIIFIIGASILLGVVFHGQAFNNVLLRFLSKFCLGLPWLSEYVLSGLNKLPIIVSGIMIAISDTACSALAIYIGLIFYFLKLVSFYEDFWEEIVYWPLRTLKLAVLNKLKKKKQEIPKFEMPPLKDLSFHLTIFMIWLIIAIITTPSLLVWAKNNRYSTLLENDPFFTTGIVLSICGGYLWQGEVPRLNLRWSVELSRMLLGCSVLILVYSQTSLHRLQVVLTAVVAAVTIHQLAAPSLGEVAATPDGPLALAADSFVRHLNYFLGSSPASSRAEVSELRAEVEDKQSTSEDASEPYTSRSGSSSDNEDDQWKEKRTEPETSNESISCADVGEISLVDRSPTSDISISSFENISFNEVKG